MSMIAPEALIRKPNSHDMNSLSGDALLTSIAMNPDALPNKMARAGTWRLLTVVNQRGASPLSASANKVRAVT